jgi:hypothetical protein
VAYLSSRNKVKKRPGERAKLLEKYVAANNKKQGEMKVKMMVIMVIMMIMES